MKRIFGKEKEEEHDFWMSYTDLISGFLIIFIIASIVYYVQNKKILDAFDGRSPQEVTGIINEIKSKGNMININQDFKEVFDNVDGIEIMPDSVGSIRFYPAKGANMMFESDSAVMLENLQSRIRAIGKKFVSRAIELKKEGKNILEIRIEGHTDTDGTFLHNMSLSSGRAFAVYSFIHDKCDLNSEEKQFVEDYMISVGYSYAKTVVDDRGYENKDKSRRIEFKIITK